MSWFFRRRRRDVPEVRGRPFDDSVDTPSVVQAGGPQFFSPNRRLPRREFSDSPDYRGYGGAPHAIFSIRPLKVGRKVALVGRTFPPMQAFFPAWSAFRSLAVAMPSRARFCVQRKQRREVLFAKQVAGRRGLSGPYRRTESSNWRC